MGYEIDRGSVINYFVADFAFVLRVHQVTDLCLLKMSYQSMTFAAWHMIASECECRW